MTLYISVKAVFIFINLQCGPDHSSSLKSGYGRLRKPLMSVHKLQRSDFEPFVVILIQQATIRVIPCSPRWRSSSSFRGWTLALARALEWDVRRLELMHVGGLFTVNAEPCRALIPWEFKSIFITICGSGLIFYTVGFSFQSWLLMSLVIQRVRVVSLATT